MDRVIKFDHSDKNIGLYTRSVTLGEELDLVENFIDYYTYIFLKYNKSNNLAIFVEPQISSGFPDIVFASYSPKLLDNWSYSRENLTIDDLKVLSYLLMKKERTEEEIILDIKISDKDLLCCLERLIDADMIFKSKEFWKPIDKKNVYNINKLVAIEAKLSGTKKLVEQSFINTWFASSSFALTNANYMKNDTLKRCEKYGVGLYCKKMNSGFKKIIEARKIRLPLSYQSLLFNEWIGRKISNL